MNITPLSFTKGAVSLIVGSGIATIVKAVVVNNTSPEKIHEKVALTAGTFVVAGLIADKAKQYTDEQIDELADWYNKNVKPKLQK